MKWVKKAVYIKHRVIVLNKEGRQLKRFYVFIYACMYTYVCYKLQLLLHSPD